MKISTFTRYGLRAIVRLAVLNQKGEKIVSLKSIAKKEKVSIKYLEAIFSILNKNNYITAIRGKNGGYHLAKSPHKITTLEVIEVLNGQVALVNCVKSKKIVLSTL